MELCLIGKSPIRVRVTDSLEEVWHVRLKERQHGIGLSVSF